MIPNLNDHKIILLISPCSVDLNLLYQVTYGDNPVVAADIEVNITVEMTNGSVVRVNNLTMLDNGYGGKCHS